MSLAETSAPRSSSNTAENGAAARNVLKEKDVEPAEVFFLSLPTIHCAGCISAVERALDAYPGVIDARVNLTQKRARVTGIGLSPEALIETVLEAGYEAHELDPGAIGKSASAMAAKGLLARLAVAGFAMMNVMLLSVAVWSGATEATRDLFHWISAAIALPAIAYSAQPFFLNAWTALSARRLNMDVPISMAILLASALSLFETMSSGSDAYFDAALSLTFFLLAGRYLDARMRTSARSAAEELSALEVPRAHLVDGSAPRRVALADLVPGSVVRVYPGERIPVDGEIILGESELDQAFLTGETVPVSAKPGQNVTAGEINLTGPLDVRVLAVGENTVLRRLQSLVAEAERARNRYTSLADRAAQIYAPVVHLLSAGAFVAWYLATGDLRLSIGIAVATLIITCPCALGLAVPAVSTAATGALFRRGILLKHPSALERLAEIDRVVFDKTGTLTEAAPVLDQTSLAGVSADFLAIAKALASGSAHPLSRALEAGLADMDGAQLEALREHPGHGISARHHGVEVRLGRPAWVGLPAIGQGPMAALSVGDQRIALRFKETPREGAAAAIAGLRKMGITVELLSGDAPKAVETFARRLGIADPIAAATPEAKAAHIAALRRAGKRVLMVGDGLNDTAALAEAHAAAAPASAMDASRVAADIVLLREDLATLPLALATARSATRRMVENFAIAAAYNAVAIPIAVSGLATPLAAALAMSGSSVMVSLNAMRLSR